MKLDRDEIRRVLLSHGYKQHEQADGSFDFRPYVYAAAEDLLARQRERCAQVARLLNAPAVAGAIGGEK